MVRYTIKRVLGSLVTLLILAVAVFMMMRLMPEEGYFSEGYDRLDRGQIEAALAQMGLRDPITTQLYRYLTGILQGNLGRSIIFRPKVPVLDIIAPKIPYSVYFGLASIGVSLLLGIPLGIMMARFKGRAPDNIGSGYVVLVKAVAPAVCYIFLQLYLSSWLKLPMLFNARRPSSWILPVLCMSLGNIANYAMWMRRYMVDELNRDYIKLARAKGMPSSRIMVSHVLRNAFVPMAQLIPTSILLTISGSIYVESLFSIPGMGGLLVNAIQRQDNTLVQALVLIFSSVGILGLFLGDILMAIVDPRIKLEHRGGAR
ncbi:MAG: ABC transporter permease [Synergistaceae bacterium]|jgi:oligopeptide transport system permease protein|nr:ABC transporter permease [Synergistaceae bacterium]